MNKEYIFAINNELKTFLEGKREFIIAKLVRILKNREDKSEKLFFEYEYDYLNIVYWWEDVDSNIVAKAKSVDREENEEWKSFMPKEIETKEIGLEDDYEGDDFDEIYDEYNEQKYKLFENWFCKCWEEAIKQAGKTQIAYFSIHDTAFRTNLNTGKKEKM